MRRPLRDNWWYIERPVPLPLLLAVAVLIAAFVLGAIFWPK